LGGAADGNASVNTQTPAFRWLQPQRTPHGWKLARLPSGKATFAHPRTWRPIRTDPGTASVALLGHGRSIRGYLNLTPRQGAETLANWPSFRIEHLGDEGSTDVRLIASAHGLSFRSGHGTCVIDSYRTSRARYREIACLVALRSRVSSLALAPVRSSWAQPRRRRERKEREQSSGRSLASEPTRTGCQSRSSRSSRFLRCATVWPVHDTNVLLVLVAAALFLAAYGIARNTENPD
jgi:hypothetical protein